MTESAVLEAGSLDEMSRTILNCLNLQEEGTRGNDIYALFDPRKVSKLDVGFVLSTLESKGYVEFFMKCVRSDGGRESGFGLVKHWNITPKGSDELQKAAVSA